MNKVFIIAEAGSNWKTGTYEQDVEMAKKLIDIASEAKADAVKFQTYRSNTVYVPNAGESNYLTKSGIKQSITKIFDDLSMPYKMIPALSNYCENKNIQFMSTPFSVDDAKAIDPFVRMHKIASYEITHSKLIEFVAKSGKPLILSTGASTYEDISWALEHYKKKGGKNISLMQTTAKYPAPLNTLNLNVIPNLKKKFGVPIGLSDHSRDPIIGPITAVAIGASIIEKHFTIDNKLPGPDHFFALQPDELKIMVNSIRDCELSLGSGKKNILSEEKELNEFAQRGIQAIKPIKQNEFFENGKNIDILRPGNQKKGLHPKFLPQINGKKATRSIDIGEGIQFNDYD
jgi:N,N'-diacetyllegionaminate synthase